MASFLLPSSIQKRLLRYALSRLELLDTDSLDLEHLDISWGTKSTLEFRDVGLRLKKLSTLLQLPPNFALVKARIITLRLTIPVDIYSSSIVVDVDGVEGTLQVLSDYDPGNTNSNTPTNHDRKRKSYDRKEAKNSTTGFRNKGKELHSEIDEDGQPLPSAVDLAQSFLQTEPLKEKAELEAAINSQSQALHESVAYSDDGEDDSPLGTGTGLTLPAFMANFLKGIVDRLQVHVHGITLHVDVDVPNDFAARPEASFPVETVILELKIDDIDIEGVTFGTVDATKNHKDSTSPTIGQRDGKRRIYLCRLRGALISDASVFANLARSSATTSPSTTHFDLRESRKSHSKPSSIPRSTTYSSDGLSSPEQSPTASRSQHRDFQTTSSLMSPNPLQSSTVASDSGRFDDALEDEEGEDSRINPADSTSDIGNSVFEQSAYLDQVTESQFLDEEAEEDELNPPFAFTGNRQSFISRQSPLSTPRASLYVSPPLETPHINSYAQTSTAQPSKEKMVQSTFLPLRPRPNLMETPISLSQPFNHQRGILSEEKLISTPSGVVNSDPNVTEFEGSGGSSSGSSDSSSSSYRGEDALAQSQLFSHQDAESMYMSALSQGSVSARVPGGWESPENDSGDTHSLYHSQAAMQISQHDNTDNLEHAQGVVSESLKESLCLPEDSQDMTSDARDEGIQYPEGTSIYKELPEELPLQKSHLSNDATPARRHLSTSSSATSLPTTSPENSSSSVRSSESGEEYSKAVKQLFSLDEIAIFLPPVAEELEEADVDSLLQNNLSPSTFDGQSYGSHSVTPIIPGSFSVHSTQSRPKPVRLDFRLPRESVLKENDEKDSVEVVMGKLETQFDVSVGRLITKLFYSLSDSLSGVSRKTVDNLEVPSFKPFALRFSADRISVKFLERLASITLAPKSGTIESSWVKAPPSDVLLRTTLKGLNVKYDASLASTTTAVTLEKFIFGYAKENIVSFDADLRMRESTRDLASSAGVDLSIHITQTRGISRYKISTLPVHVSIDLQKLDETFSWFGGLSSVLNMGSSIASTATLTATGPAKPVSKPRGVRFEAPIKPDDNSLAAQNKVDARIGGFVLDLVGKDCSVGLDTTAVKIVGREEGLGMAVDKIKISGPHLHNHLGDPAISANIMGTRIEFLQTPKDVDLDRLLSLITPSKAKYDRDDDILLDTLLRQRRQGSVLRITVDSFKTQVKRLNELNHLPELGEEIAKLSTVAKYLPEDDRPGLLSLILVRDVDIQTDVNETLGFFQLRAGDVEIAQITFPSLVALSVKTINVYRNTKEELLGVATDAEKREVNMRLPAIMARMIGDEMEPVIKIKLWNLRFEYRVPLIIALLGLPHTATTEEMAASLAASVATLTDRRPAVAAMHRMQSKQTQNLDSKSMVIDIGIQDCILGLNPLGIPSKVLVVLTDSHISVILPKDNNSSATAEMSKGSILVIDDVDNIVPGASSDKMRRQSFDGGSSQVADLCATGFVSVSYISSAKAVVRVSGSKVSTEKCVDIELRDDLLIIESCADSTQTLITVLNGLKPPTPPSKEIKYRTKVIPVQDLLASLSGDAFGTAEGNYDFDEDFGPGLGTAGKHLDEDESSELDFDSHYYNEDSFGPYDDEVEVDSATGSVMFDQALSHDVQDGVLLESFKENQEVLVPEELNFQEEHFGTGSIIEGTAHRWNSAKNTYDRTNEPRVRESPLKVCVRDVHIIWNLFDGYDWQHTRDAIAKAVQDVESKAVEKRARNDRRPTFEQDIEDEETVIGDFLFNSIYIGIPANRDPRELAMAINQELNDNATETESIATTTYSASPSRQGGTIRSKGRKLRLHRSKHHKIAFELKGVNIDLVAFPPGSGETESSVDIRIRDFDIFDHVPSSTWRKFATYMQDAGERESGTSQIHLEILNVKPVPELAASEIVLKATILPLRLHVDQDALDFITRFFEFKDDSGPTSTSGGDVPFIQRAEVNSVVVKLDFKPKRVDYAGLRSGHTTEFMNFLILDEADMVLRHTIIYGVSGFDKLGKCLNDIWMPDIKRNQLPGILAGLAPVRSLANVGVGMRDLVVVPMREYRKDGRVVRSISKGAAAFARTTGTELVKLGAKLAIGTQTVLQGTEELLTKPRSASVSGGWEEDDLDVEEKRQISLYADQPIGVVQGLRGAYASLERDLALARDAIIAVPGEVMESGTAQGAAKAVLKRAPTVILRPVIGASKAISQTLMGATNSLDPHNRRRVEDKYKKH